MNLAHDGFSFNFPVELCGYLLKKSDQNNKFQSRYCIIKDSILFWYKDEDVIKMKKNRCFLMKAQGMLFLQGCLVRVVHENNQQCIVIEHSVFQFPQIFSVDSEVTCNKWIDQINFNSNINYHNMLETERFIKEMMNISYNIPYGCEKQSSDPSTDGNQQDLVKEKESLERENQEKDICLVELQGEFNKIKEELDDAYKFQSRIKESQEELELRNEQLQLELKKLDDEKSNMCELLISQENSQSQMEELQRKLIELNLIKEKIDEDRKTINQKLLEKEAISQELIVENQAIIQQAQELNEYILKLTNQNESAQKKLQMETAARLEAEQRLFEAQRSLGRLHSNITDGGTKYSLEEKNEMKVDVNTLKNYFERIINRSVSNETSKPVTMRSPSKSELPPVLLTDVYNHRDSLMLRDKSKQIRQQHKQRVSQIQFDI